MPHSYRLIFFIAGENLMKYTWKFNMNLVPIIRLPITDALLSNM